MNDDRIALIGCAIALLMSGGFLAISLPMGRLLRRRTRHVPDQRTVAFQIPEATEATNEAASDRRAA